MMCVSAKNPNGDQGCPMKAELFITPISNILHGSFKISQNTIPVKSMVHNPDMDQHLHKFKIKHGFSYYFKTYTHRSC